MFWWIHKGIINRSGCNAGGSLQNNNDMGRELKRVPLDFVWPIGRIWHGYINPYYGKHAINCPHCDGRGETPEMRNLSKRWYGTAPFHPSETGSTPHTKDHPGVRAFAERNVKGSETNFYGVGEEAIQREAQRLADLFNGQWAHHLSQEDVQACWDDNGLMYLSHTRNETTKRWERNPNAKVPTAKEVNDQSAYPCNAFDKPSMHVCVMAAAKRMKIKTRCSHCKGTGSLWDSPRNERLCKRWKSQEPPKGAGYQLWATTNEGEPMSPVFATLEELCEWLEPNASTFGNSMTTKDQWMNMLGDGLVYHKEGNVMFV